MSFQISSDMDKNKVFLVRSSELEGRLDPAYNLALMRNKIISCFKKERLDKICKSFSGGTPSKNNALFWQGNIPWVSPKDMKEFYLIETEDRISEDAIAKSSTNIAPENSVLIVFRSGILQHTIPVAVTTRKMAFNQDIKAFIFKESVIPNYAAYFFNIYQSKLLPLLVKHSTTVQSINTAQFNKFEIPVPPIAIQSAIVAKMDAAYSSKREKEAEAQRLLDSIDDYLLGELGIELPEQEENTVQSRIFTRRFSEISGGRFDAPVYQKTYLLETKLHPMIKFKECVIINPLVSFSGYNPETLASFLPMEKVSDRYGEAKISDCRTVNESGGYTKFKENDLLWAKITPCMQNGKSAVVNGLTNGIGFGSTEFHVFRAKREVDVRYIHGLLRLVSLRKYAMLYFSGSAGHQRVSDEFFAKLSIPLPPLSVQTEIADHITLIRSRAKQLQQEAKEGLEQAKRAVEAMILGDA